MAFFLIIPALAFAFVVMVIAFWGLIDGTWPALWGWAVGTGGLVGLLWLVVMLMRWT